MPIFDGLMMTSKLNSDGTFFGGYFTALFSSVHANNPRVMPWIIVFQTERKCDFRFGIYMSLRRVIKIFKDSIPVPMLTLRYSQSRQGTVCVSQLSHKRNNILWVAQICLCDTFVYLGCTFRGCLRLSVVHCCKRTCCLHLKLRLCNVERDYQIHLSHIK